MRRTLYGHMCSSWHCHFLLIFPFGSREARAQIVSLLLDADKDHVSLRLERTMKRHLEEDDSDVKKITFREGVFLYVQIIPISTAQKNMTVG